MKLGIGSYTYTWAAGVPGHLPQNPLTALGLLQKAVTLGVKVVQFCDNLPLTGLSHNGLAEVKTFAATHQIDIEIGMRGIADESSVLAHLELAKSFNAPFVRVVLDSKGHEPSLNEAVLILKNFEVPFKHAGVKLAVENHDRFTSGMLAELVQRLGTDWTGICLDTVNSFGALEGPEVVVKTLMPYTLNLHFKDFTIQRVNSQMGYVINGCPAGQGRLNASWLLSLLSQAGRDVNVILELWTPPLDKLDATLARESAWAEESVQYLRRFVPD